MDFWITIVGLLRRRRVVVPAVLMALTLGAGAYAATAKTYVSSTTMVLTTTEFGGTESGDPTAPTELTNPLLNFSDSLRTTSAILIQAMNSEAVAARIGVHKPTKLVVDDGRSNPDLLGLDGPFLFILVQSTSPEETASLVKEAQVEMRKTLTQWQHSLGAPSKTYVALIDVVPPTPPEVDQSRAIKLGVIAAIYGFALIVGLAYVGQRRRARKGAGAATESAAALTAPPSEDPPQDRPVHPDRSRLPAADDDWPDAAPGVASAPDWDERRAAVGSRNT